MSYKCAWMGTDKQGVIRCRQGTCACPPSCAESWSSFQTSRMYGWHWSTFAICNWLISSKINPKIIAILRPRIYYGVPQPILQFKTHIWGLTEFNMGGCFHAATSLLAQIDRAKDRLLRELGIGSEQALLGFNFPSQQIRRHIGILGLLHKSILRSCHPRCDLLLPWYSSRFGTLSHNEQLYGHNSEVTHCQGLFNRSIFAMTDVYNNLPQHVVDAPSVKIFQKYLKFM